MELLKDKPTAQSLLELPYMSYWEILALSPCITENRSGTTQVRSFILPEIISQLQLPSAVILEPKKIKSVIVSTFSPFIHHEVMELIAMILV